MRIETQERGPRSSVTFGVVFAVLAILTILEVVVAYLQGLPAGLRIGILVFLAVVKVAMVLLYFMHLRYDGRLFALPFALGIVLIIPVVLIVTLTVKALGTSPENADVAPLNLPGQVIEVTEVSFNIHLSQNTAHAGTITFHVVNGAQDILHEFIIIKTDLPADQLPENDNDRVVEEAVNIVASADSIPSANGRIVTVNLDQGHYVLVCNLPGGHYEQGMRVDFNVTGTSSVPTSEWEQTAAPETPTP